MHSVIAYLIYKFSNYPRGPYLELLIKDLATTEKHEGATVTRWASGLSSWRCFMIKEGVVNTAIVMACTEDVITNHLLASSGG